MKILVVSQYYYPENFRITDVCEELVKRGHHVEVLTGLPNYPEGVVLKEYKDKKNWEQEINGVKIHRTYEYGRGKNKIKLFLNYYSVSLSMKRKAKKIKEKFDLVLINQLSPVMVSWAGIAYAKKHKVPCLLYCYDLWPDSLAAGGIKKGNIIFKYFYKVSNKCYKKADTIMVTSKSFIKYFEDYHKIESSKIKYLPQYCEDIFELNENNFNDTIEKKTKYNYVFAGNIGKMQSVETIIKAASLVQNEDITIHIVGDGSNLENCKNLVESLNVKNVIFYGRRPLEDMPKFYSLADAMIVTLSKNDIISKTLPGKVQSYMCAGKPIIGCIDGECFDTIKEAQCGLVCESENYEELSKLFIEFKSQDFKLMKENSKKYYQDNFTKQLFFERLEKCMIDVGKQK